MSLHRPWIFVENRNSLRKMLDNLMDLASDQPDIFLNLTCENLTNRAGRIFILQLFLLPKLQVYLVDVLRLGKEAFTTRNNDGITLKYILEAFSIRKAVFDVRNDSWKLHHLYGIDLANVDDIQLMENATRSNDNARYVSGLAQCVELDTTMSRNQKRSWRLLRESGKKLFDPKYGGSYSVFYQQSLPRALQSYCVQNVLVLPILWNIYSRKLSEDWQEQLWIETCARIASSHSPSFNGIGQHMALAPRSWGSRKRSAPAYFQTNKQCLDDTMLNEALQNMQILGDVPLYSSQNNLGIENHVATSMNFEVNEAPTITSSSRYFNQPGYTYPPKEYLNSPAGLVDGTWRSSPRSTASYSADRSTARPIERSYHSVEIDEFLGKRAGLVDGSHYNTKNDFTADLYERSRPEADNVYRTAQIIEEFRYTSRNDDYTADRIEEFHIKDNKNTFADLVNESHRTERNGEFSATLVDESRDREEGKRVATSHEKTASDEGKNDSKNKGGSSNDSADHEGTKREREYNAEAQVKGSVDSEDEKTTVDVEDEATRDVEDEETIDIGHEEAVDDEDEILEEQDDDYETLNGSSIRGDVSDIAEYDDDENAEDENHDDLEDGGDEIVDSDEDNDYDADFQGEPFDSDFEENGEEEDEQSVEEEGEQESVEEGEGEEENGEEDDEEYGEEEEEDGEDREEEDGEDREGEDEQNVEDDYDENMEGQNDDESVKDYTACSADCGFCGHCAY
ncbi:hypothetical protein MMC10_002680 [Thelotrema lepadinum]|nr:hypothetical protein [Thelotrema lepadinum]